MESSITQHLPRGGGGEERKPPYHWKGKKKKKESICESLSVEKDSLISLHWTNSIWKKCTTAEFGEK